MKPFSHREDDFPPILNFSNLPESHQLDLESVRPERAALKYVGESETFQSSNFLRTLIG